jgi:hypothetical protein
MRGNIPQRSKYGDLEWFYWRVRADFATLILKHRKFKRLIFLGVPPEISIEEVSSFLNGRGIRAAEAEELETQNDGFSI